MRGDRLAGRWQTSRAIEANPIGLTLAEVAKSSGAHGDRTDEKSFKSLFQKMGRAFLLWGLRPIDFSIFTAPFPL